MRARRSINEVEEVSEINVSPLIDMVFILLIFFIVTTVFVEEEGINVDKPTPQPPDEQQEKPDEPVMIKVTVANQVIHDGKPITMNRVETVVKNALSKADVPVIMQVERGALSGTMIQVMDRAKLAGADKISVTAIDSSS